MVSPSGFAIAAAAGGTALLAGLPIPLAAGAAAAGWTARVGVAAVTGKRRRRTPKAAAIDPFTVGEPWRRHVVSARRSQRQFTEAVSTLPAGPLRDRLGNTAERINGAVADLWRLAQSGHALTGARRQIDDRSAKRALAAASDDETTTPGATDALQAQVDAAKRLDNSIAQTQTQVANLDVQLAAATTRALELVAHYAAAARTDTLDADLQALADDMEALRLALEETDPPPPPELP